MIKKMIYKEKEVETKTELCSYLMGAPIFDRTIMAVEDVPINKNIDGAFKALSIGDTEPFFFISEMKIGENFPTAYGDIMTKEWANSFVNKLDTAPFPLSSLGHTNVERPWERVESHGYVIGGLVRDDSMFLRNYLLPGKTEVSMELAQKTIREMKAGMLSTSISNIQQYIRVEDPDNGEYTWHVVLSITGQRNDIVEHDLTGSDASIIARSFKTSTNAEEDQSANKNKGEQSMDKKEMLQKLRTLKGNGELSIAEIAENFGLELVTEDHKKAVSMLKNVQSELGVGEGDVITTIKSLKTKAARVEESEFEKVKGEALKETFKDNEIMLPHAEELFSLKSGSKEDCVVEAKRIASLKTITELASKIAGDMSRNTSLKLEVPSNDNYSGVVEM